LSDRVDGAVSGLLEDEERLEESRKRVGRIGQSEMTQGIGDEQVTELVVEVRERYGVVWKQGQAERDRKHREGEHTPARAGGEFRAVSGQKGLPEENEKDENRREREFDEIAGEKTNWTFQRQKFRLAYREVYTKSHNLTSSADQPRADGRRGMRCACSCRPNRR
jgi:hypothetical protein